MGELETVQRDDPEDVFALLSDDIRVEILQTLWEADKPVGFADLREASGVHDSGQFNYHLDKLVGRFVRKTPEGYELTQAGKGINGAIEAGAYTLEATVEPVDLDDPCPYCGGARTLVYEDDLVNVECESCELSYHFVVPPGVFAGYDTEAIPRVASRYLHAMVHQIRTGFCWFCEGRTRSTVELEGAPAKPTDGDSPKSDEPGASDSTEPEASGSDTQEQPGDSGSDDVGDVPVVHYDCGRCGHRATTGLWLTTFDHPAVRSFYYEHGIDIRDCHIWEFPALDPDHLNVLNQDPLRASVTHTVGSETLTLVLNEDADVVAVRA